MTEREIFLAASELADIRARAEYLDEACGRDSPLRMRMEALLRSHEAAGSFLGTPAVSQPNPDATLDPEDAANRPGGGGKPIDGEGMSNRENVGRPGMRGSAPEPSGMDQTTDFGRPNPDVPGLQPADQGAGTVIVGKYTLVEIVGEGGMGSVWRAKQTEPVKRFVAVKLIKAGMDSRQVLSRFEAERQALALMDHPNIAKVLDGGLHDNRPFFVMELVKGVPITDHCDQRRLPPKERLELFVQVCQAIQHAHQKGIIHRDIKPNNVLVAMYDDRPVVKVIDFGVAKATGGALTESTLDTGFGGIVGTPQYMSPEQATFNNLDIDTRSDVYALGVLLYELLTGSPPFSKKELEKRGLLEILRVVREDEPPRPSTKLSTADALPSLSANRGTEPRKLTGLLRNELDWIVMKALEKDRTRRYETANGFAADVLRYLSGEAVQAHPPSRGYRLKKFARRNRGQVTAAALVLFALLAGMAGTTVGLVRAEKERQLAEASRQAEADRAEGEANERRRAEAGEKLAGERLSQVAAERDAKEVARQYAEAISKFLGEVFQSPDPSRDGRTITVAETLDRAVDKLAADTTIQPGRRASLQSALGNTYNALGLARQSIPLLEKVRNHHLATSGPEHPDTLSAMNNLANTYFFAGRREEALKLREEVLKFRRKVLGPEHSDTLSAMNNLANSFADAGRWEEALKLREEVLTLRRKVSGPEHPDTLSAMNNLASSYSDAGRREEALKLREEVLTLRRKVTGPEHPDTLLAMSNLAVSYFDAGRREEALKLREEVVTLRRKVSGPEHPDTLRAMGNLANSYFDAGRREEAIKLREEVLTLRRKVLGPEHPDTLTALDRLITTYRASGQIDKSQALQREKKELGRGKPIAENAQTANELAQEAIKLLNQKKWMEAEAVLRDCLRIRLKIAPELWPRSFTQSMLGGALLGQKKYSEAEPLLIAGYEGLKKNEKAIPSSRKYALPNAADRLIEFYTATNKPDEAKKWRAERAKYPEVLPMPREVK